MHEKNLKDEQSPEGACKVSQRTQVGGAINITMTWP